MNSDQAFPGKYETSGSLEGKQHQLTIESVAMESIGTEQNQETKPVLYCKDREKGFVLNKTKWAVLESAYGSESDEWAGKAVIAFPDKTMFKGKLVACIGFTTTPRTELGDAGPTQPADEAGAVF